MEDLIQYISTLILIIRAIIDEQQRVPRHMDNNLIFFRPRVLNV